MRQRGNAKSVLRMELEWATRGRRARTTKQRARLERLEALKTGKLRRRIVWQRLILWKREGQEDD